jgi:hypothetical protein
MVSVGKQGNANVPITYNDGGSPHLGGWVYNQRQHYRKGVLSQDRIDQLEHVGLVWRLKVGRNPTNKLGMMPSGRMSFKDWWYTKINMVTVMCQRNTMMEAVHI